MGIVIEAIHRMEDAAKRHWASVRHNGHGFDAVLVGDYDRLLTLLGEETSAEYGLTEIHSVEIDLPKDDATSGVFPLNDGRVVIDGTVHNETIIDEHVSLFDVYLRNKADFFNVSSEDLSTK